MEFTIDIEKVKSNNTFFFTENNKEHFFCRCGTHFELESMGDDSFSTDDEELGKALGIASISLRESLKCPKCDTNYKLPLNQKLLCATNNYFISSYKFEDDEEFLSLKLTELKAIGENEELSFVEKYKKLSISKSDKKIYFETIDQVLEVDLDKVFEIVDFFLKNDTKTILNSYDLHQFCTSISEYVTDIDSIDVVKGLLEETKNRMSASATTEVFKKILTIFLSIIKFDNLSTIALTKNPIFLYELLKECNPPTSQEIKDANVTSPLKIFNYLANNYIKNINQEISQDKINYQEMTFKEGDVEKTIKFKSVENYKEGKVTKDSKGNYDVIKLEGDGNVSKYIYNKIKNFQDYKQLIKYLKILEYNELVDLLNKFEYDMITSMIDILYYRDGITFDEIKRLVPLFIDHCLEKTKALQIQTKVYDENVKIEIDYKNVSSFDFGFYDDCLMMLKTLEFDPRKDFYKIKTNAALKEFHDKVVKYYNAIKMEEDEGYMNFFDNFRFLETFGEGDYLGPLEVEILDTPTKVVQEGRDMHHSAASYVKRVMDGEYILLKVTDLTPISELPAGELTRFTMGIFYNEKNGFEFEQVKSYSNKIGSNRFKDLLKKWLEAKDVLFDENKRPDIKNK